MLELIETIIAHLTVFGIVTAPLWFVIILTIILIKADKEE